MGGGFILVCLAVAIASVAPMACSSETESQPVTKDVEALCQRYVDAHCDFLGDCFGLDEERCQDISDCSEATDADEDDVDACVAGLDAAECDDSLPRACADAVSFPDGGSGGNGGASGAGGSAGDGGAGGGPVNGDGTCVVDLAVDAGACDVDCDVAAEGFDGSSNEVFCTISCFDGHCDGGLVCQEFDDVARCMIGCDAAPCPTGLVCATSTGVCLPE